MMLFRAITLSKMCFLICLLMFGNITLSPQADARNQNWQFRQQQVQQQRMLMERQRIQRENIRKQREALRRKHKAASRLKAQREKERLLDLQNRKSNARSNRETLQQNINNRLRQEFKRKLIAKENLQRNHRIKERLKSEREIIKKEQHDRAITQLRQKILSSNISRQRLGTDPRTIKLLETARRLVGSKRSGQIRTAALNKTCSFHGDTLVMTDAGLIPIRDIHPDTHRVWAKDEESGETGWKDVLAHYANVYDETLYLTILDPDTGSEQTITANRIHPFFALPPDLSMPVLSVGYDEDGKWDLSSGQWIEAQDLEKGQRLFSADGTWDIVSDLNIDPTPIQAFNLTVDEFHTYFVAQSHDDTLLWVHNDCPHPAGPKSKGWDKWLAKQKYADASYHGKDQSGVKSPAPIEPMRAFGQSYKVSKNSDLRIGYDQKNRQIVLFRLTGRNEWHGYVVRWEKLTQSQKNTLISNSIFNRRGKLIADL